MSHGLVRRVLHNAPADLTLLERMVLVVIAEAAQDRDRPGIPARVSFPSMEVLMHCTGKGATAVRAALRRLEARGLDVREPYGTDRTGRPVYAYPGRATRYRLPQFATRKPSTPDRSSKGVTGVTPSETERRQPSDAITGEWRHGDDAMASLSKRDGVTPVTPNQKEPQGTTPLPPARLTPTAVARSHDGGGGDDPQREKAERAARSAGITEDDLEAFVDLALADVASGSTTTTAAHRIGAEPYRREVLTRVRRDREDAQRAGTLAAERMRLHSAIDRYGPAGASALTEARRAVDDRGDVVSLIALRQALHDLAEAASA